LTKGTRVVISSGPLTGFEGIVVSSGKGRVVLRLQLDKRFLQIELDEDMVSRAARVSRKPSAHSSSSRTRPVGIPPEIGLQARVSGMPHRKASPKNGSRE
jgi:hypothetical protein